MMAELSEGAGMRMARAIGFDLEPQIARALDRKRSRAGGPAYIPRTSNEVREGLTTFLSFLQGARIENVKRLGGGASREQFVFDLVGTDQDDGRYVLRMDPHEPAVETERRREFEAFSALASAVPVPRARWLAEHGEIMGQGRVPRGGVGRFP